MKVYKITNKLIKQYGFKRYLEIGVRNPEDNFDHVKCETKHSVDPNPLGDCTYKMTSDDFFNQLGSEEKYDVIFVDGMHDYDFVMRDIENSLKHLRPLGFILVHDTDPPTEIRSLPYDEFNAIPDKKSKAWNGDGWKAIAQLRLQNRDIIIKSIDARNGLTIIQSPASEYWNKKVGRLSYAEFKEHRKELLGIMKEKDFFKSLI